MKCLAWCFERNIILSCILFLSVFLLGFARQMSAFFYSKYIWTLSILQSFHSPTLGFIMRGFSASVGKISSSSSVPLLFLKFGVAEKKT
jgi:hypothetical protein